MFDYMYDVDIEGLEVPTQRNFFTGPQIIAADDRTPVWESIDD